MVRFLVIIFDGASEDVPNEDLTLIKDEFSLYLDFFLFLSLVLTFSYQRQNDTGCSHDNLRCGAKKEFAKRSNLFRILAKITKIKLYYIDEINVQLKCLM